MTWRVPARTMLLVLFVVLAVVAWGAVASATTSTVRSLPNGDLAVTTSAGTTTDKDKDGDFNTGTKPDTVGLFHAVANQSGVTQTVRIEWALDAPGTEFDRAFTQEVLLAPGDIHQASEEFRIRPRTRLGGYSLSVTASGTESATAVATFTVN